MNTLRFAHPTGLLPGEWRFPPVPFAWNTP
jgi:hypothetical protein